MSRKILVRGGDGYIVGRALLALTGFGGADIPPRDLPGDITANTRLDDTLFGHNTDDIDVIIRILRTCDVRALARFAASIGAPESTEGPSLYYRDNTPKRQPAGRAKARGRGAANASAAKGTVQ